MEVKPGDKIMVKIGHRNVETFIDEKGVQRISPVNKLYELLYRDGAIDLNLLAIEYEMEKISFKDYFDFYLSIRYSVDGFASLSRFQHLTIKNPLWEN